MEFYLFAFGFLSIVVFIFVCAVAVAVAAELRETRQSYSERQARRYDRMARKAWRKYHRLTTRPYNCFKLQDTAKAARYYEQRAKEWRNR